MCVASDISCIFVHIHCKSHACVCIFVAYVLHISCIFVAYDCIFKHVFAYLLHMPAWLPAGGFSSRAPRPPRLVRQWQCRRHLLVPNPNHPTQTIPSVQHFDRVPRHPVSSRRRRPPHPAQPARLSTPKPALSRPPSDLCLACICAILFSHSSWGVPAF